MTLMAGRDTASAQRRTAPKAGGRPRNPSLSTVLSVALSAVIAVAALLHTGWSYMLAASEIHELLDRRLQEVASRVSGELPIRHALSLHHDTPEGVVVQVWLRDSPQDVAGNEASVRFPLETPQGFSTQLVGQERWRVYSERGQDWTVHVAQRETSRQRIAEEAALTSAAPALVMIPLAWLAILFTVRRVFRPVGALGERAAQLDLGRLQALPTGDVPRELLPLVTSINLMIERLSLSLQAEKMFIADAAHELRSPLTALQIQADNLGRTLTAPASVREFQALRHDIARSARLVAQLLRLARADAPLDGQPHLAAAVGDVVSDVVATHLPNAAARGIDLGVDRLEPLRVAANAADLRTAISNLVDNAIKYSKDGATIDLRACAEGRQACIEVRDTGPGIDPAALPRVFDRFYRAENQSGQSAQVDLGGHSSEGSGLGLAIVRAIVQKYGGEASLENRSDGIRGVVARIRLPLAVDDPAQCSATAAGDRASG